MLTVRYPRKFPKFRFHPKIPTAWPGRAVASTGGRHVPASRAGWRWEGRERGHAACQPRDRPGGGSDVTRPGPRESQMGWSVGLIRGSGGASMGRLRVRLRVCVRGGHDAGVRRGLLPTPA